jgi:hypothetical protein
VNEAIDLSDLSVNDIILLHVNPSRFASISRQLCLSSLQILVILGHNVVARRRDVQ